uniref:Uncharacterized protein n=1 Tax=Equus asinus TaxID=9793 RepID=A0A9L0ICS0_EQUAS
MPLAQLREPWPLMELVPLDPEVSERGGGRAPAAGEPGSPEGRGGPRRRSWLDKQCHVCTWDPNLRTPGHRSGTCELKR